MFKKKFEKKKIVKEKILGKYFVKIYETDPYFYQHYKELRKVQKNGRFFMLFKIDAYFLEHNLALEIDEKALTDRDLIFEQKRQEGLEKILDFDFIRINTSKEGYDAIYEIGTIQTFLSKFKAKKIKKLEEEIKKL